MNGLSPLLLISVVIPTFNRAALLRSSLHSLTTQTLSPEQYEIVVVNDGSTDQTTEVCKEFADRVTIRCLSIANSGISAAKNLGLFAAAAPIVLFFDDDDLATPTLLAEHLRAHADHPDESVAVLGYTCWGPGVCVTLVMEYVIDIGQFLFAFKNLRDGQTLDYSYFWGGRSSCKRSFLAARGVFNADFRSIIEDIELGYRLSKHGLRVVFCRSAVSHMVRPITFEEFCHRCERKGHALTLFSRLHPNAEVQHYCQVADAFQKWIREEPILERNVGQVREIEGKLDEVSHRERGIMLQQLHALYHRTFNAFRLKGIVAALREESSESACGNILEPSAIR